MKAVSSRSVRRGATLAVTAVVWLMSRPALALDGEVTGDAAGQFYDVRSPTGETVLTRRRFTAMLGASAYNLLDAPAGDPKSPDLSFRLRLRYDTDYGASAAESDPTVPNSLVPGTSQAAVDLMYAYVEGRRFARGLLGFRVGRQYVTDVLGWWSFDGGEASVTTPYFVKAEIYGGLEQRGGLPLSTSRFEGDGIWRGNRTNYPAALYPSFETAAVAPAIGAAIESTGLTWIHGRLTYRRVYNTGSSNVSAFDSGLDATGIYRGMRISSDRLGYAVDSSWSEHGGLKAGIIYDLYRAEVTSAYATLDAYVGPKVTLSADYDYYVPAFDGDSIWNFFAGEPRNDVSLRGSVKVDNRLSVAANGHVRIFTVQTGPFDPGAGPSYSPSTNSYPLIPGSVSATYYPSNGHPFDEGGNVSVRWRTGETRLGLNGSGDFGSEGDRAGADATGERVFDTRYVVSGRAGVWQWKDHLRPDRDATSFNYVAALGYRFAPRSQGSFEWEHDLNGLVGLRFRIMLSLSVGLTP